MKNTNNFESKLEKVISLKGIKSLWKWSKGHRFQILLITLEGMLVSYLSICISVEMKGLVAAATMRSKNGFIHCALIIAAIIGIMMVLGFFVRYFRTYVSGKIIMSLRKQMVDEVLKKKYPLIKGYHSGELVNRTVTDVNIVTSGILDIVPPILSILTQFIGAAWFLFRISPIFLLIIIAIGICMLTVLLLSRARLKRLHRLVREKSGQEQSIIQETYENVRIVKASAIESKTSGNVLKRLNAHFRAKLRQSLFSSFTSTATASILRVSWFVSLAWGCYNIYHGRIGADTLIMVMQLVSQVQSPFLNASGITGTFYAAVTSAERLDEIFDIEDEDDYSAETLPVKEMYSSLKCISFDNVSFSYERDDVLKNVSVSLNPGDFVSFTGLSGGGKSTMFLLLLGIYTPDSGAVSFKFEDSVVTAGRSVRTMFSYVPQGNALFSGTLRENVTMFSDNKTEEEIADALKKACIYDFVLSLPEGLETVIGEKSLGLSEGQAQRIAIARALLSDAPILLLDEATSALDEETEAELLKNISEFSDKTCLIVTHRKAALGICNRHLQISDGLVTESVSVI